MTLFHEVGGFYHPSYPERREKISKPSFTVSNVSETPSGHCDDARPIIEEAQWGVDLLGTLRDQLFGCAGEANSGALPEVGDAVGAVIMAGSTTGRDLPESAKPGSSTSCFLAQFGTFRMEQNPSWSPYLHHESPKK